MALFEDVIVRGTRASQPAANAVVIGTLYFVTDELVTERSNGSAWQTFSASASSAVRTVGITIDGGGSVITTGVKGFVRVPFSGTISKATLLSTDASATSGSIVIDVWKDTYANYPPTDADSITASAPPTLSSASKSEDSTLSGWTTSVTAGNILGFNVDSATTVTRVTLLLDITT